MKKILRLEIISIIAVMLFLIISSSMAAITVNVNGNPLSFSVPPRHVNGRTMVPLRSIFEALGALVNWDPTTRMISVTRGDTDVHLSIGDREAYVNGQTVKLDTPAMIINGTTMVPLRFVSEALGANVQWTEVTQNVSITIGKINPSGE